MNDSNNFNAIVRQIEKKIHSLSRPWGSLRAGPAQIVYKRWKVRNFLKGMMTETKNRKVITIMIILI